MMGMYHYNPSTALEELTEDATLPNPVHVRDMMLRRKLTADQSLELNRIFLEYQKFFGEAQKLGQGNPEAPRSVALHNSRRDSHPRVKFHDMVYILFRHILYIFGSNSIRQPTLHGRGALAGEIEFADHAAAVIHQHPLPDSD